MPDDLPKIHRGKRNKPSDSNFCQQRLNAWRPLLTARCIYPVFILIGAVSICLGVVLHLGAMKASELTIWYTDCLTPDKMLARSLLNFTEPEGPTCEYNIILTDNGFEGDVTFLYGMSNYYQNNRQYIRSRNDLQLFGTLDSHTDCEPDDVDKATNKTIAPCGRVANSMFNDTFSMVYHSNNGSIPVPFSASNVIHAYERERKYKNPPYKSLNMTLCEAFNNTVKPTWWKKPICMLGDDKTGRGFENVDFIVWMNTAPLPDFRKIYRTLNRTQTHDTTFHKGLPPGNYTLHITYNYNVIHYNAKKSFVIATTSWSGPKNYFLGIAYMTVGLFLFLLGCGLVVYDCINRKMKYA
uniref:Cell cycle control protein 50A n=1 Tax=Steinernema glaseri TaxID=37863 RepID=A0A1I8AVB9_9BILA